MLVAVSPIRFAYRRSSVLHLSSRHVHEIISRIFSFPSSAIDNEAVQGRIRAEQISNIKRYLSAMLLANVCNAAILIVALWASPQHQLAIAWASATLVFTLYHGFKNRHSAHTKPSYVSRGTIIRTARNALFFGSLWAMLPLLFFSDASPAGQVIIACLCAGVLGGGTFVLASVPAAAIAFTAPIVVASAIAIVRSGDPEYLVVPVLMISYIAALWRAVYAYASQIGKKVAEQVQVERRVRRDELTSLPNRLAFSETLEGAFARLARLHERFAVLYLDLNDFKAVNDRFGHSIGDRLLVQVSQRLKDCVRQIDLVARLSGDEFAVIVADVKDANVATIVANRIVSSLDTAFVMDGIEVFTGACIGIAFAPADGGSPELLLKCADQALYEAKRGYGGIIQLYDPGSKEATRQRRGLERDLRSALRGSEFFLVFQPIFALDNNRIAGCEALLRWRHPTLGVRRPAEFVHIMEETGLINEIGHWIFLDACKEAVAWPKNIRVAVNVSAKQLRQTSILSSVVKALTASALQPNRLEIEITETAVIDESEQVLSNIRSLRDLGVRIALDDFGTGYSSLTYLRRLSPDSIKIDGLFVREMATNAESASIVKSLIALSHDLGINVVAEGIETAEQLHFLRRHNCEEGQGYFLSRPKPPNEIEGLLLKAVTGRIVAA
jgi:diguanylate cyclase (GGDEF)-like protein